MKPSARRIAPVALSVCSPRSRPGLRAVRPAFGLPELLVAIHTSRQSCSKAGKARRFALVWESSGESRFNHFPTRRHTLESGGRLALEGTDFAERLDKLERMTNR
jgi:hypothetical protein